ncbi:K(+)-transporting ATPase subunit F [Pseudomonas sp. MWU13-2860]|nr:K(+)-transporting ATPase subunit F [Pseudomonas sp. MWU13-2860]
MRAGRLLCRQRHHALESPGYKARAAEPAQPQLILETARRPISSHAAGVPRPLPPTQTRQEGILDMAIDLLLALVVGVVIYLFYAVINPEKF